MHVRDAVEDDAADFRWIARSSLRAAYGDAVSPKAIDAGVEELYSDDRIAECISDPTHQFFVAEVGDEPVGFVDCRVAAQAEEGTVQWVHVDPDRWAEGVGDALLEEAEACLFDRGVDRIEGTALAENQDLVAFYEGHGYVAGTDRETTIGDESFTERSYLKFPPGEDPHLVETRETAVGTLYVALDDHKVGSKADFYAAYHDQDRESRYGFYCNNCGSVDTAMDAMGRVECNNCSNSAKPTRWDAAYL